MKHLQQGCAMLATACMLLLTACGGSENEATETDATTVVPAAPEPVSTIVTTPENMMVVMHKVADFGKWLVAFEAHQDAQLSSGLHRYVIGRGLVDTNMVLLAMKADDFEKAKAFAASEDLKTTMIKAGVTGPPEIHFIVNEWQDTANVGPLPRALTSFMVKDKDAWRKSFDESPEQRTENGLIVRNIGYEAGDNKSIHLVTALTDTAKAFAYYKSDVLKKRMEEGGLTTPPKRFLFTIVKRY